MSIFGNAPTFDCKVDEWPVHKAQINNFFEANGITEWSDVGGGKRRAILLNCMTQDSYRLARDLLFPETPETSTYGTILSALDLHFSPKKCLYAEREKFYAAIKDSHESMADYAARLRGLAAECKFGASLEMCMTDRFVLGVDSPVVREKLYREDATQLKMNTALEIACAVEGAQRIVSGASATTPIKSELVLYTAGRNGSSRSSRGRGVRGGRNEPAAATLPMTRPAEQRCTVCGARSHVAEACGYQHLACDSCGVKGHLRRMCPSKISGRGSASRVRGSGFRSHYICEDECCDSEDFVPVNNVRCTDEEPMVVEVCIRSIVVRMEVDSGSAVSVLPANTWRKYFSNEAPLAQAYLYDKLRKQSDRQKEICKFISSSNQKLEAEIRFAEQEIKSLNLAIETIKFGNTELKKGYLLCKERKAEIFERTKAGKTKYENIWLTSKSRYENIPSIKKIIDVKNKNQTIQASIKSFMNDSKDLINKIEKMRADLDNVDKARVIELAQFIIYEKPKTLEVIKEKNEKIKILSNEIEMILNDQQRKKNMSNKFNVKTAPNCEANDGQTIIDSSLENNQSKNIDKDTLTMPKLHLQNNDLDLLSIKLHQIKKDDLQNISQTKRAGSFDFKNISPKRFKTDENVPKCNTIILNEFDGNKDVEIVEPKKYSDKKLIHILEDIRLEKIETYNIINKLQPNEFQETKFISSNIIEKSNMLINSQDKISKSFHVEEIEVKDLTPKNLEGNVVAPPSQFVDIIKCTQEGKKTVSFNIPKNERIQIMNEDCEKPEGKAVQSPEKILNCSTISEESYTTIKDMVLKKHNLDLSPQFMYTKNPLTQKQDNKIISSKFFENKVFNLQDDDNKDENQNTEQPQIVEYDENNQSKTNQENIMANVINVDSTQNNQQENNIRESISGFLFNHGPEGIPESLNVSISTTGFDDSEEFPQCIDSSILLSPKADLPVTVSNCNNQVLSQEVPNFLAGFRKKGFSFFGSNMSEPKPDSSIQKQNGGFNFSFGNDEKKARGGLFNMFH